MISIEGGAFVPIPFGQMVAPDTCFQRVRLVDTESARYRIARRYMNKTGAHQPNPSRAMMTRHPNQRE